MMKATEGTEKMAVPETIVFQTKFANNVVVGVELPDSYYVPTIGNDIELSDSPMAAVDDHIRKLKRAGPDDVGYAFVRNTAFEAIVKFDAYNKRGVSVKRIDMAVWYSILPIDLLNILQHGQNINGHMRGVWQVQKRQAGFSLALVKPLPFATFDDNENDETVTL